MNRTLRLSGLIAAGLLIALGRYPVSWILSRKKKIERPKPLISNVNELVDCPSGNRIYVEFDGVEDAQPIILLHGLNASTFQWYYQRLFLRERYRLIIIDLPGHGKSSLRANMDISAMAEDLKTIIAHFGIRKPVLYGHSMGGMVILQYCSNYKYDLKGIILQHCTYKNPLTTCVFPRLVSRLQNSIVKSYLTYAGKRPLMFRIVSRLNYFIGISVVFHRFLFFTGNQTSAQLRFISRIAASCPPEVTTSAILESINYDVSSSLQRIHVPSLIIAADDDRVTLPFASRYIAEHIANSRLVNIRGGHQSMMEFPGEVNQIIGDFLHELS